MWYSLQDVEPRDKERTHIKLICCGKMKVVGLHIVGMAADEMLQGFGVATKDGCDKKWTLSLCHNPQLLQKKSLQLHA